MRLWECLVALALISAPSGAGATSTGIIFNSGKQGGDCNACHGGGSTPVVRFDGPMEVVAGEMATYIFSVESQAGGQTRAGFNVAASAGTLGVVANQGEQLLVQELTHNSPKRNVDRIASWTFTWRAPEILGPQTLFGAGNSVNFNNQSTGDRAARTTLVVEVVGANPTATPTPTATPPPSQTPTEPPPTDTATPSPTVTPTNTRRPTPMPTATSTATVTAAPTATPVLEIQPGNANCDDRLSAADIVALLPLLPAGTLGECGLADADCDLVVSPADLEAAIGALFGALPPLCDQLGTAR